MLLLILGIALVAYVILTYRIKPERYPQLTEKQLDVMLQKRMQNCRRYAALFLIYVLAAIGNGLLFGHISKHLSYILIGLELIYVIAALTWVIRNEIQQRK